ncbi:hypothetical protein P43SY_006610 [Pythium insidiosum]|uniref:CRAL-TRIO domain-containing protein n=1 Tax=Pythium insidiosum TaxID=114742 RepID=A0AAD5Q363_PYTIN|nr:hypothetical protein P43SY_006610 [Pythium insidiosum]
MNNGYGYAGGYGHGHGGGMYTGGFRTQGDVPTALSAQPTAMEALESAVALPGVFTPAEMQRTLRRNHFDVMKTALQLREKHAFRQQHNYEQLNIGLSTLQNELKKGYVHFLERAADLGGAPIVLLLLRHFKPHFSGEKTQLKGVGTMDGSSTLEDTRRLCVYMMDLAVEAMEENRVDGVLFLVDLDGLTVSHFETQLVTDILLMLKTRYPEVIKFVLVLNGSTLTRGVTHLLSRAASERTQQRIKVLQHVSELRHFIAPPSIPQMYGGSYQLMTPLEWMRVQAEIEGVDLESQAPAKEEQKFMTKDARQLNGMQYAACSVDQVVEMKTSVIRGPLYRNKSGVAWVKMYGILRPEALLLYETVTSKMPQIIIPVNDETNVAAAQFADAPRGSFGFRVDVPGVAGGHLLAACSEHERGNWLQEIQMNINAVREEIAREQYEEEKRLEEERAFAKLNMISFDDPTPAPAPAPAPTQSPAKQHQPQPAMPVHQHMQQHGMMPGMPMPPPAMPVHQHMQQHGMMPGMPMPPVPGAMGMMPMMPMMPMANSGYGGPPGVGMMPPPAAGASPMVNMNMMMTMQQQGMFPPQYQQQQQQQQPFPHQNQNGMYRG